MGEPGYTLVLKYQKRDFLRKPKNNREVFHFLEAGQSV